MKKSLLKLATASAVLLLAGCGAKTQANESEETTVAATETAQQGDVIATVGDASITFDEFYKELKANAGVTTLRSMIIQRVLTQNVDDAEALKTAANEEVDTQVELAGGEAAFEQLLLQQNLGSIDDFRESVFVRNLFQEVISKNVDTSEETLKAYYEDGYSGTMEAQHILVETKEEADAVLERLNAGEEFDAVAKEVSLDGSAADGGYLGQFTTGQMIPEFEEAVKSVANGELVPEPVETQYGFHVIKTINNGEKKPYDEVKDDVKQQYLNSKFNDSTVAYSLVGKFIREKGVEIKDNDLKATMDDLMATIEAAENTTTIADEAAETTVAE